jgi:hypothetical protein
MSQMLAYPGHVDGQALSIGVEVPKEAPRRRHIVALSQGAESESQGGIVVSDTVSVELVFFLSQDGQRDALAKGLRPTARQTVVVSPDDPNWPRVVALKPDVDREGRARLEVGAPWQILVYEVGDGWSGHPGLQYPHPPGPFILGPGDANEGYAEYDEYPTVSQLVTDAESDRHEFEAELRAETLRARESLEPWQEATRAVHRQAEQVIKRLMEHPAVIEHVRTQGEPRSVTRARQAIAAWSGDPEDNGEETADKAIGQLNRIIEAAEAAEWVRQFGSARLKKTVAAGLMENALTVYVEERLAAEHPGWSLGRPRVDSTWESPHNPTEEALDVLLEALSWDPQARMMFVKPRKDQDKAYKGIWIIATFLGREVFLQVPQKSQTAT